MHQKSNRKHWSLELRMDKRDTIILLQSVMSRGRTICLLTYLAFFSPEEGGEVVGHPVV